MKIGFVCHKFDKSDQINGSLVRWVEELARRIDQVQVMSLEDPISKPTQPNIRIRRGCRRHSKTLTAWKVLRTAVALDVDAFFIWQGGHYPGILKTLGKPIFQWKCHPYISRAQNFYSTYISDITFTSTELSYPGGGRVEVVGHGIDTELFCPSTNQPTRDYVMAGRIASSKRIELGIEYAYAHQGSLTIVGPVLSQEDKEYTLDLVNQVTRSGHEVRFLQGVPQRDLVDIYNNHHTMLNFSETALDRTVLEGMACGLSIITTNPCAQIAVERGIEPYRLSTLWDKILPLMKEVIE